MTCFQNTRCFSRIEERKLAGVAPHREASEARSGTSLMPSWTGDLSVWVARPKSLDSALARISRDIHEIRSTSYFVEMLPSDPDCYATIHNANRVT